MTTTIEGHSQRSLTVYFGYGSNLWLAQMEDRCPGSKFIGIAKLPDWRWMINERGYANVVPSEGDVVYGLLYELTELDEQKLDRVEGVPIAYIKKIMAVQWYSPDEDDERRVVDVLVYTDERRLTDSVPKKEYVYRMNMAITDAIRMGVPKEYIDRYLRPFIPEPQSL